MKKIIPLFLVLLLLSGCKTKTYTPVINEDFKLSAIYKTGDFSYLCDIEKKGDSISITPTSTRAKGLVINCDGKTVSFMRKDFVKTFEIGEMDKTNPALLLQQVFSNLQSAQVNLIDGFYTYSGNCSLGNYILKQSRENAFVSLEFPRAGIRIDFNA